MKQYKASKYILGLASCIRHIVDLVSDADCLLKEKRYARAYALLVVAVEEVAKINMMKSWAVDRMNDEELSKEERSFREDIFTDHIGKLKRAFIGLSPDPEFKRKWAISDESYERDFLSLMKSSNGVHSWKNRSLYLHIGTGGFEAPENDSFVDECNRLRRMIQDLLRWVKGGTHYFIEETVGWHLSMRAETPQFHSSIVNLREALELIP